MVAIALVVLVIGPAVNSSKQEDADRRAKAEATAKARRDAVARRDQRARTGGDPELAPAETTAARHTLVADIEKAITTDANARFAAGTVGSRTRSTSCEPFLGGTPAEDDLSKIVGVYDCTALIREIKGEGSTGRLGYPFRAVVDFRARVVGVLQGQPDPERAEPARPAHDRARSRRPVRARARGRAAASVRRRPRPSRPSRPRRRGTSIAASG